MAIPKCLQFLATTLAVAAGSVALAHADKLPAVPKWQPLELTFKSSHTYTNALQEAEVRVLFVSPLGETNRVYGFWDGGKTWHVRYQPTFPGRWTYYTMCSDTANAGLHEQTGSFLCTASKGEDRFASHGPILVARDQQHFEHADRTGFLWLGDAAWAHTPDGKAWESYVTNRAAQKFTAIQWALPSGTFTAGEGATLNLAQAKIIDAKLAAASNAGLLSAIAPLWEIGDPAVAALSEDQAIARLRYCVARWGAANVAWVIAFDCDSSGTQAARWQRIGRAVFNSVSHAPVILFAGDSNWVLDGFRRERWVDALGFQTRTVTDENSLPWLLSGPLSLERRKVPARPLVTLDPPNANASSTGFARRVLWWSLLLNTPAGVSCVPPETTEPEIAPLNDFFATRAFWLLQPVPGLVLNAAESESAAPQLVTLSTENRDFTVIYVPGQRTLDLAAKAVPMKSTARWFNPRNGESLPAKVAASAAKYQFTTPTAEDWVLVIQATK